MFASPLQTLGIYLGVLFLFLLAVPIVWAAYPELQRATPALPELVPGQARFLRDRD